MGGVGNDLGSYANDERKVDRGRNIKPGDRKSRERNGDGELRLTLLDGRPAKCLRALMPNELLELGYVVHSHISELGSVSLLGEG